MSSESQTRSSRRRWRAPVVGAVAGLAVAAAIIGQSALASGGSTTPQSSTSTASNSGQVAAPKSPAPGAPGPGSPNPFLAAVTQLVQAGTITQAQAQAVDAQIQAGRIDTESLMSSAGLSAAQMQAINDKLIAIKKSLAAQAPAGAVNQKPSGPAPINCSAVRASRVKATR